MSILKRCALMGWIAILVLPLSAHQLVLKDGRIIKFDKYRVTETTVLYVDADGKEIAVPLRGVDLERTQQLNAQESVPLKLPGMVSPASGVNDEAPLGDTARKAKGKDKTATKRVYTNDDFPEAVAEDSGQDALSDKKLSASENEVKTQAQIEKYIKENEKLFADLRSKTTRQLANEITNGVAFPGHERWEEDLSSAKDRLVTAGTEANRLLQSRDSPSSGRRMPHRNDERLPNC